MWTIYGVVLEEEEECLNVIFGDMDGIHWRMVRRGVIS